MRRRDLLGAFLLSPLFGVAAPVEVRYREYWRCLPEHLKRLAREARERRIRALDQLTTPEAIAARQRWVRENFWRVIGGEPSRTPLNARTTGSLRREGYTLEKLVFESQPNFYVTANLYLPAHGKPPYPAVLFQCGHSADGKAAAPYQACCQGLAKLGFVVLTFDPMGQGERTYYPGSIASRTRLGGGADDEHTVPGKQMLLIGDTATRLQTWDAVRALDYLYGHPWVDRKRIGATGQSGGGTNTMFLAAVDDRISAAVVTCGNTENLTAANFIPPGSTDDAEQDLIDAGLVGLDRWDLLYPFAPKPLLIVPSARDFFGTYSPNYLEDGRAEFARLQRVYGVLRAGEQVEWVEGALPHGLSYDLRMRVYGWFRKWLLQQSDALEAEPAVAAEAEEALFATERGSTVLSLRSETPASMAQKRQRPQTPIALETLLRTERPARGVRPAVVGRASYRDTAIEAIEIQSAREVWLPAYVYRGKRGDKVLIVTEPGGRLRWQEGGLYERLAAEGYLVCALDVRGFGEMSPEYAAGPPRHAAMHRTEQQYAWASLWLGKPLLGQRVSDLLAAVEALCGHTGLSTVRIAARDVLTVPALMTAALDKRVEAVYLSEGLLSFGDVLRADGFRAGGYVSTASQEPDPFGNFVTGILLHTDLPQIATSIAPRRVVLAGTVGATGQAVAVDRVRDAYRSPNVAAVAGSGWTAAAIAEAFRA